MVNFRQLRRSVRHALRGIAQVAAAEQNFRIQLVVSALVIAAMFILRLRALEMAFLTLAIALVLVLELLNSIFERLSDMLKPQLHDLVKEIKDIMAGTVLIAALGAAVIGVLIFWPYLADRLGA